MDGSNSKNFSLMILLAVILLGLFGYTIFSSFTDQPMYTDLSNLVGG